MQFGSGGDCRGLIECYVRTRSPLVVAGKFDHVTIFFHTSEHDRGDPQRSISATVTLPEASNDSLVLIKAALHGVARTWREQPDPP